mmetsp:Transcript_20263/g.48016  ORF Transcript_20263/g.48016 Transcript_20263/m.48016 type:complete len:98 (-) Transcript_20263:190-483(-)|eukprot:CAMPEP_0181453016 /NCGR_PEP_ID=MMETSP1110-20121109/29507_1 /TAXON_ID=174948 /ORGANISM="Symbiodinium sp., Strain CCMP421" /LENGTH=97 /DNA_ID=CAMNT_0023577321 /DNA_START=81 /DNA_END=374 /DNA_ORIENTATION=+
MRVAMLLCLSLVGSVPDYSFSDADEVLQEMQRAQQLGMAYLDQKQKEASMATRATSLLQVQTSRTNDERPEAKFNPFKPDPALARSSNPMLVEDEED